MVKYNMVRKSFYTIVIFAIMLVISRFIVLYIKKNNFI